MLDLVRLRMDRVAAATREEMKRGLNGLAVIASVAPLAGFLGVCLGIFSSFKGCAGQQEVCLYGTVRYLSEGVVPAALGLFVAIPAWFGYRLLSHSIDCFALEMSSASIELVNRLARLKAHELRASGDSHRIVA